jgi:hypothetical protein
VCDEIGLATFTRAKWLFFDSAYCGSQTVLDTTGIVIDLQQLSLNRFTLSISIDFALLAQIFVKLKSFFGCCRRFGAQIGHTL